jgi:hypothetical protein
VARHSRPWSPAFCSWYLCGIFHYRPPRPRDLRFSLVWPFCCRWYHGWRKWHRYRRRHDSSYYRCHRWTVHEPSYCLCLRIKEERGCHVVLNSASSKCIHHFTCIRMYYIPQSSRCTPAAQLDYTYASFDRFKFRVRFSHLKCVFFSLIVPRSLLQWCLKYLHT